MNPDDQVSVARKEMEMAYATRAIALETRNIMIIMVAFYKVVFDNKFLSHSD
jgi:hypothetical protein